MIEINLLPEELRKKEERVNPFAELPVKRGAIMFVIGFFGIQLLATVGAFYLKTHYTWVKAEVVKLRETNKEILAQKAETASIKKKTEKGDLCAKRSFYWSMLLNALSDSATKGVWLRNFSVDRESKVHHLLLEGSVVGKGEETALAGKFIKELKSNPMFDEMFDEIELSTFNQTRIKDVDVYNFRIVCNSKKGKF